MKTFLSLVIPSLLGAALTAGVALLCQWPEHRVLGAALVGLTIGHLLLDWKPD